MNQFNESNCLFVVAQGRSGSTLLLKLLNNIEGYNICGENYGAISNLAGFYQSILKTTTMVPKKEGKFCSYEELINLPKQKILSSPKEIKDYSGFEWYNIYNIESIENKLQELIIDLFNPEKKFKVWGFKEIRFGIENTENYTTFSDELNFIKKLFPKAKFLFLTRNIESLLKSAWWAENPEKSREKLEKQQFLFQEYHNNNIQFSYSITYNDLINNTKVLHGMYDFLGEEFELNKYQNLIKR